MSRLLDAAEWLPLVGTKRWTPTRDAQDFPGSATAGTTRILLPTNVTLYQINLHMIDGAGDRTEAEHKTDIDEVRLVLDGRVHSTWGGDFLTSVAEFYMPGSVSNGNLPIFWHRLWNQLIENQDNLALGLRDVKTAQLEIDHPATHGITAIDAQALVGKATPMGDNVQIKRLGRSVATTGEETWESMPLDPSGKTDLLAMHIMTTPSNLSELEILFNEVPFVKGTVDEVVQRNLDLGRENQSDMISIDFAGNRDLEGLPLNPNLAEVLFNWASAPNAHKIYLETAKRVLTRQERIDRLRA